MFGVIKKTLLLENNKKMKIMKRSTELFFSTKLVYLSILLILIISSCKEAGNEFDPNKVVNKLAQMSDLGTVEFQFTKIIDANDDASWYKIGSRKILISAKAYVKAGVDFSAVKVNEVDKEKKKINVTLPPGKIISVSIPADQIKILFNEAELARNKFSNKEIEEIETMGEKNILKKIKEMKLEDEASKRSILFIENWLKMSGFNEVIIN